MTAPMTEEAIARVEEATSYGEWPESVTVAFGFTVSDLRALLSLARQGLEADRLRDCLLGIALTDRYRRYPKQHEDGGLRGQSGLRAVRALTGQHGSHLTDDDVSRLDKEARAALQSRSR